jgi:hypothetical protein
MATNPETAAQTEQTTDALSVPPAPDTAATSTAVDSAACSDSATVVKKDDAPAPAAKREAKPIRKAQTAGRSAKPKASAKPNQTAAAAKPKASKPTREFRVTTDADGDLASFTVDAPSAGAAEDMASKHLADCLLPSAKITKIEPVKKARASTAKRSTAKPKAATKSKAKGAAKAKTSAPRKPRQVTLKSGEIHLGEAKAETRVKLDRATYQIVKLSKPRGDGRIKIRTVAKDGSLGAPRFLNAQTAVTPVK